MAQTMKIYQYCFRSPAASEWVDLKYFGIMSAAVWLARAEAVRYGAFSARS